VEESLRRKATACVKTLIADVFRELRESAPGTQAALSSENQSQQHQGDNFAQDDILFSGLNFDFLDAFTMLGDEELCYDQGGLLDNIMQPGEAFQSVDQLAGAKKLSDSGYGSNSSDESFQASEETGTMDDITQ
jgi:hypothetical protein